MPSLEDLAQAYETPVVAAFALGLLTAVSPCPLATNITATAYISRELKSKRAVLLSGLLYTIGRGISYVTLGLMISWGASKFHVARLFQSNGELFLGPLLIFVGLVMVGVIRFGFLRGWTITDTFTEYFKSKGFLGAFVLGLLFALAFCPYSGVLFFGMLIPLTVSTPSGLFLPLVFATGTGLPVIFFSCLLAFSASGIGKAFSSVQHVEKVMRYLTGGIFIATGIYYVFLFFV